VFGHPSGLAPSIYPLAPPPGRRLVLMAKGGKMVYTGPLGPKASAVVGYLSGIEGARVGAPDGGPAASS